MTPRSRARRTAAAKTSAPEASAPEATPETAAPAAEVPVVLTLESAFKASAAAFRKAGRDHVVGPERNAAYAAQAQVFIDNMTTLGLLDSEDPKIVAWVRQGRKNIALAAKEAAPAVAEVVADAASETTAASEAA